MKRKLTKVEIANLKKLGHSKKYRDDKKLFLIEGRRAIEELFREKKLQSLICEIFMTSRFVLGNKQKTFLQKLKNFRLIEIDEKDMQRITATENPSGIIAVIKKIKWQEEDVISKSRIILVLDKISDPGNLGTIIRSANAFGCDLVMLTEDCVDLYNPKVVRSSAGSIFGLPIIIVKRKDILKLRQNGHKIISFSPKAKIAFEELDYNGKMVFLFGNEAWGVGSELEYLSDLKVRINMKGKTESLNVAVACSVALYECSRRS